MVVLDRLEDAARAEVPDLDSKEFGLSANIESKRKRGWTYPDGLV